MVKGKGKIRSITKAKCQPLQSITSLPRQQYELNLPVSLPDLLRPSVCLLESQFGAQTLLPEPTSEVL
ncbi:hypothetical protein Pyn_38936 [Prunus yedoensis var. nudiflora]|uniref:Uncharacterized protein n=1 Tax=Prunus yedoensis var. nudiflora TaxID=2094558 RepID=A0A314Y183_PRUYE|nr:hypothetical protein Pyn_38936 [Prunus yedoensis var. nudiflora]